MKKIITPSEIVRYRLDGSDYHSIIMESGIIGGELIYIQRVNSREVSIRVRGIVSASMGLVVERVVQVIQHDDGKTTDYMALVPEFPKKEGTHQK